MLRLGWIGTLEDLREDPSPVRFSGGGLHPSRGGLATSLYPPLNPPRLSRGEFASPDPRSAPVSQWRPSGPLESPPLCILLGGPRPATPKGKYFYESSPNVCLRDVQCPIRIASGVLFDMFICLSLSLSLYIYIYIYIFQCFRKERRHLEGPEPRLVQICCPGPSNHLQGDLAYAD